MRFVDTNVLLYALTDDPEQEPKVAVARSLLHESDLCLSVQVLQEFYYQATRPTRARAVAPEVAAGIVRTLLRFRVQELTPALVLRAIATQQRHLISYWDAAILEAARAMGCSEVLSEDLSDDQDYDGVRVVNPFAAA